MIINKFYFNNKSSGLIEAIGSDTEINMKYKSSKFNRTIDAKGKSIIPGLVDGHTHPVWAGDRVHEFAMKVIINHQIINIYHFY